MEQLVHQQEQTGAEIQRLINDYRTKSKHERNLTFLRGRLEQLDEQWDAFDVIDTNIREQYSNQLAHAYYKDAYYDKIKSIYETYRTDITDNMVNLQAKTTSENMAQGAQENPPKPTSKQFSSSPPQETSEVPIFTKFKTNQSISSSNTVEGLIRRQKGIMALLKRVLSNVNLEGQSKQYCIVKINAINEYWSQIKAINEQIWETAEDMTLHSDEEYCKLEDFTQNITIELLKKSDELSTENANQSNTISTPQMKLPKIALPKFDGEYLKWTQFHDLFTQMVHEQPIGKSQKMWFLKTNLTGEAELLIRHLSVSEENYVTAWEILNQRYNNKRLLTTALLDRLVTQPTIASESAIATAAWDPILLHLIIKKLDKPTHTLYEQGLQASRELQCMANFFKFLEQRFQSLETLGRHKTELRAFSRSSALVSSNIKTQATQCKLCNENHGLFACQKFLELEPPERFKTAQQLKVCTNCLKSTHLAIDCPSRGCSKCMRKHNTLLHRDQTTHLTSNKVITSTTQPNISQTTSKTNSVTLSAAARQSQRNYVILGTVVIEVLDNKGVAINCRAILDSGSQLNFVTERLAKKLNLQKKEDSLNIQGIGEIKQHIQHRINVRVQSRINDFSTRIEAFILPQITAQQPAYKLNIQSWPIPSNIKLADPGFNKPDRVDLLLGAEIYYQLLSVGQIRLGTNLPTLQNTVFGWIVAGSTPRTSHQNRICGVSTIEETNLEAQVERFWRLEEATAPPPRLTAEQEKCETHFSQTVRRDHTGRFVVKLPFLHDPHKLGESKDIALRRFLATERRLSRNSELATQYKNFISEYKNLGHMREINLNSIKGPHYFLPHHAVLKPDSTTTSVRVVFDGSSKTSTNVSLNDILCTGPTIQDDLFTILLRFRMPRFAFTADIEKMYRQIMVDPADRRFQLIWWRDEPTQSIKCFALCTVTYGTTSAPYLATRCLQQLAKNSEDKYPLAAAIAKSNFYVDDLMTGTDSLVEAIETQKQLQEALNAAGFKLRKWCANHPQLLKSIPAEDKAIQLDIHEVEECIKTLGLIWTPKSDEFCIKATYTEQNKVTKRTVLSDIAHLFDPLGIVSPVVVTAKIFLQHLWHLKLDWDAALPMELHSSWLQFRQGLKTLADIKIPRHMFSGRVPKAMEMHAFADASEKAYGAAVYLRANNEDGIKIVRLLCAKSKVAPAKPTTLPRLELCAAKLAAELVSRVKADLNIKDLACYYWTDSEITLAWINSEAASFHTFIANRIASIQESSMPEQWQHVPSKQNPADILSRGVAPDRLASCSTWFYGPLFLHGPKKSWPSKYIKQSIDLEKKRPSAILVASADTQHFIHTIDHQNNFSRWQRIISYILRFIRNCQLPISSRRKQKYLSVNELEEAFSLMIRTIQGEEFRDEIKQLHRTGTLDNSNSLSSLSPFIDNKGVMRVGGRLEASKLATDAKHPMLIPYAHIFTRLLMTRIHLENLHCGPQTLLATTRQKYWPIKGKTTARSIVGRCIRCTRAKPKLLSQFMGNLPTHRVQPERPFVNTGVDFLGPVWIHYKLRGKRPQKAYIAVFCCFVTKAVHFEVASDLSTVAFIGCLRRFVGRRGNCRNLYCDNATNFVGTKNQLTEVKGILHTESSQQEITTYCTPKGIDFHFIPPRAPHFGGLWEAAVKSAKHFLQRNLKSGSLTYEELETLMIDIEAILNSRPLTPLSADPNDLSALTPGHFLIGEPLTAVVEPVAQPSRITSLQRWKLVPYIKNQFWQRWSKEYLSELQHRYKWKQHCNNAQPGMLVVIKEDNLPVTNWILGRIIQTIKGHDGLVRVADIKTSSGVIRRPIHKLAPLPIEEETNSTDSTIESTSTEEVHAIKRKRDSRSRCEDVTSHEPQSSSKASPAEVIAPSKRKHRSNTAVSAFFLTCLILPILGQVNIKPFKSRPGLYFESMGNAHLISNEWNIVVHYNLSTFWQEYDTITSGVNKLMELCEMINDRQSCESTLKQFENILIELQDGNELLLHQHKNIRTRRKRAPLNIIGNLASSLFGVLDTEYADKMAQVIEDLNHNDNHLLELIKNQISIIDSTANIIKNSQEAIENRIGDLDKYLNITIAQLNNMNHELHQQRSSQTFTDLSLQLVLAINRFERMQSNLWDVLIDTHHGKINPYLLAPSQLGSELTHIQEHLPPSLRLPAKPDDLTTLYKLMSVQGRITPNQMMFRIKLPLFSHEHLEMLRIVSVPFVTNKTLMAIKASTQFLIINLHRDQYYPLSESELNTCTIGEEDIICKQHHPLYNKESNRSACEISFITQSTPRNCEVTLPPHNLRWIQLINPNQWIYTVPKPTAINIVCGSSVTQTTLEGSGILEIGSQCIIKDETSTIRGHNIISSTITGRFITSNLTELSYSASMEDVLYQPKTTQNLTNDIRDLQRMIDALRVNENLPLKSLTQHDIHQFTIGYMSLLLIIAIAGYLTYRFISKRSRDATSKPPIPLPRTTSQCNVRLQIDPELLSNRSTRGVC